MLRPIPKDLANSLYDILVNVCQAHDHADSRSMFVDHFATEAGPGKEYRFGGMFGMAGKIWLSSDGIRVSGPNHNELAEESDGGKESQAAVDEANRQIGVLLTKDFFSNSGCPVCNPDNPRYKDESACRMNNGPCST